MASNRLRAAGAAVAAGLVFGGCAQGETEPQPQPQPETTIAPETTVDVMTRAEAMWGEAALELQQKITDGEPVDLVGVKDSCFVWENFMGGSTVVKDPAMYMYVRDNETLLFVVFVSPNGAVMNGPFHYEFYDASGQPNDGLTVSSLTAADLYTPTGDITAGELTYGPYRVQLGGEPALIAPDGLPVSTTYTVATDTVPGLIEQLCPNAQMLGNEIHYD